jgi:hypothetical protein
LTFSSQMFLMIAFAAAAVAYAAAAVAYAAAAALMQLLLLLKQLLLLQPFPHYRFSYIRTTHHT